MKILEPLINSGEVNFYTRFIDGTLFSAKKKVETRYIFSKYNSFNISLQFTIDYCDNGNLNVLDISVDKTNMDINTKQIHTGK